MLCNGSYRTGPRRLEGRPVRVAIYASGRPYPGVSTRRLRRRRGSCRVPRPRAAPADRRRRALLGRASRRGRRLSPTRPRHRWPRRTRPCRRSASTSRWRRRSARPTCCTRTPGTPTSPGCSAGSCTGRPHILTAHSLEPARPWKAEQLGGGYQISSWAERQAYETAAAVIAVSGAMRDDMLAAYPFLSPDRVHVIHNGIDTDDLRAPPADRGYRALRDRPGAPVRDLCRAGHPAEGAEPPAAGGGCLRSRGAADPVRRRGRHPRARRRDR